MPSRERRAPPLSLAGRELRAAFQAPSTWAALLVSSLAVGVALRSAAGTVHDVMSAIFAGCGSAMALAFPFVVGRALARDRESGADLMLAQLGHRALGTMFSRVTALVGVAVLLLAPAASAFVALRASGEDVDALVAVTGLFGHVLFAMVVVGVGACAAGLTTSVASARLATFVVVAAMWLHERAGGKGASFLPGAAVHVFERGVLDGRDALVLVVGGVGLALAGAFLAWPAPVEKRVLRAGLAVVALLAASLGASQVRVSVDVSADQRSSLSPGATAALSLVGDPIRVTLGARADHPRSIALHRDVIAPMVRSADVRVTHAPGREDVAVWQVGARAKESRATTAAEIVPLVLELAGVKAPAVVDTRAAPRPFQGHRGLALALCLGGWPLAGVAGVLVTRRRRTSLGA